MKRGVKKTWNKKHFSSFLMGFQLLKIASNVRVCLLLIVFIKLGILVVIMRNICVKVLVAIQTFCCWSIYE